ncbi:MAG TPA: hypothetical protein VG273_09810 [Bryobacteraceae bacterium]|jgi:hypothetical protein|nr:hypothetical protein [Bryobacteraceae bacterium]
MKRTLISLLFIFLAGSAVAADKKPPQGQGDNDAVTVNATILSLDQIRQEFGSSFGGNFTALEVRLTPKGGKPYEVRLDDFILRSQSDGDHSGPLAAAQVVDTGALVIQQTFAPRSSAEMPKMVAGTKVEMKDDLGQSNSATPGALEALKKRMLEEKTITEPETGVLFFPLAAKEKAKNLVLSYASPGGKMRIQFK